MVRGTYYGGLDSLIRTPSISEVIPATGLFQQYVARAQRLTDSPGIYHVGALLACLSAVVCKHAALLFRSGQMARRERMHLWVLLCGRSNNRKSHALDMCTGNNPDVAGALHPWLQGRLCPDSGTREGFEGFMIEHPDAFLAIREAPTWLSDNRAVWMRNGAAWWCKIFDGQLERKLRGAKEGEDVTVAQKYVHRVTVGVCAAGETTAVVAGSRPTDWTGGMFSRMMIIGAGRKQERHEFYDWTDRDLKIIRASVGDILRLAKASKGVSVSKRAWATFDAWNRPLQESCDGLPLAQSTILGRLGRHVKVVSAIYALSCGQTEITSDHMQSAVKLGMYSHKTVMELPI